MANSIAKATPVEVQLTLQEIIKRNKFARGLRPGSKKFLKNLYNFFRCHIEMKEKYRNLDRKGTLKTYSLECTHWARIMGGENHTPREHVHESKEETTAETMSDNHLQQSKRGKSVETMDELYEAARIAEPVFESLVHRLIKQTENDDVQAEIPALKGRERAQEKANHKYFNRGAPSISWLYDIVRGSIMCPSIKSLLAILKSIQEDDSIQIVKVKNRFRNPTLSGYRDFFLCLKIGVETEDYQFQHICEIQLHLQKLKALDLKLEGHKYYEYFRSYFHGSTTGLEKRIEDLRRIRDAGKRFGVDKRLLGLLLLENWTDKVVCLKRIASLFLVQFSDWICALRILLRILDIQSKKNATDKHLVEVAKTYCDIGNVLRNQGRLDQSIMILRASCYFQRKSGQSKFNPLLAIIYTNFGNTMREKTRFDEALGYFGRSDTDDGHSENADSALDIYKRIYKTTKERKNPAFAGIYNDKAMVRYAEGRTREALCMYKKSLRIYKNAFGDDHFKVASLHNNIGLVLRSQGNYGEAMTKLKQALGIKQRIQGGDHLSLAITYTNMALVLLDQKERVKAMEIYKLSLEIRRKVLGDDHASVAETPHNIADLRRLLGKGIAQSTTGDFITAKSDEENGMNDEANTQFGLPRFLQSQKEAIKMTLSAKTKTLTYLPICTGENGATSSVGISRIPCHKSTTAYVVRNPDCEFLF